MTERFSVMIVDDEENVRNLLKNCIDWSSLGICIAAEAGTAEEAFEKLTHMAPPTIICADICMPMMNGIEFITELKKRSITSEIVVISGFGEFTYAQQCIRLGISDYILKPVNEQYLYDTMKRICTRLGDGASGAVSKLNQNSDVASDVPVKHHNKTVLDIAEYTKAHFCENTISLQLLADTFYLNAAYICRAFKQECGENWVDFLTKLRMEKAIELLKTTDLKSYEIAEKVGFTDAKYFSICFKQYTGQKFTKYKQDFAFTASHS